MWATRRVTSGLIGDEYTPGEACPLSTRGAGCPGCRWFCETWEWLHPLCLSCVLFFFVVILAHASRMWSSPRSRKTSETWGTRGFTNPIQYEIVYQCISGSGQYELDATVEQLQSYP
jgi:hypothetical protein